MVAKDYFTKLAQLDGIIETHFGVQEGEAIFSNDHICRISTSFCIQEETTGT